MSDLIVWFADTQCRDVAVAGGKGSSLAAMAAADLPVPPGFAIVAEALERAVDGRRLRELASAGEFEAAQALVGAAEVPRTAIAQAYEQLGGRVAVRSSAVAEDSDAASYAGQQETYLDVEGVEDVTSAVRACWQSFFSERALFYRQHKGRLDDLAMSVVVQRMVDADKAGVLFTVDPVQRRRDRMIIEAVSGLGESLVSGEETPDHSVVDRTGAVKREVVKNAVLGTTELVALAELGDRLEGHFGCPQDVEWAIAGDVVHLLQSRPVTTL